MSEGLYKEELMDHFRYPRNKKKIEAPNFSSGQKNPSCGDSIIVEGKIIEDENGAEKILEVGFNGVGCVISQASTSMLTEKVIGKTIDQVLAITSDDIIAMIGLKLGPGRIKCALLGLSALHEGLKKYSRKQI